MPGAAESLFSLELVVEKLYLPHIVCRFPAVAFRLLDFPTLVIEHVEQELANTIKKKISRDPYFHLPDQFGDLKDKHGNFMIKKGKSCLFKIPVETLKLHLTNTPLYVMIIDTYPETPKLLGSSTVPLNGLMNAICAEITKKGESCPSVQGDKGLFKLYSLMGKEIGYFVLGFRLLCLGPSLIPHLPSSALMKRSLRQQNQETKSKQIDAVVDAARSITEETQTALQPLLETREMGSMTEAEMKDVLMQTIQTEEKAIHVALSEPEPAHQKNLTAAATQTDKCRKLRDREPAQKFLEMKDEEMDDSDGIVLTNITCPPPLLYNSEFEPRIGMARPRPADVFSTEEEDDLTIEDLSDEDEKPGVASPAPASPPPPSLPPRPPHRGQVRQERQLPPGGGGRSAASQEGRGDFFLTTVIKDKPRKTPPGPTIPNATVFPILSALLTELTRMQQPQIQVDGSRHGQPGAIMSQVTQVVSKTASAVREGRKELPPSPPPKQTAEEMKENIHDDEHEQDESFFDQYALRKRRSHRGCAHPDRGVPPNKSWIRRVPERGSVRPSKLTYGLTHTQKLRLARSNPAWLEVKEEEEAKVKAKRTKPVQVVGHDTEDFNASNFSDTLTEVRRLAEKELNRKVDRTLDSFHGSLSLLEQSQRRKGRERKPGVARPTKSPPRKSPPRSKPPASAPGQKRRQLMGTQVIRKAQQDVASDEEGVKETPASVDPRIKNIVSPNMKRNQAYDTDDLPSAYSDILDSRSQRSIEVHVPSAQIEDDSDGTLDLPDEDEQKDSFPLDMKKPKVWHKFPGFGNENESFPDSIEGRREQNDTHNESDFHPLESTRVSKNLQSEVDDSRQFHSTDDYDTKQFQSTEEPELMGLMTDEDDRSDVIDSGRRFRQSPLRASVGSLKFPIPNPVASENSPVPATRRSTAKLDLSKITPRGSEKMTPRGTEKFTPRDRETPMSSPGSSLRPSPRPRRPLKRESVHTDSVSSYMPSDAENLLVSLSSDGNYSDDFHVTGSGESITDVSSSPELPRLIPSTKLGFTIS